VIERYQQKNSSVRPKDLKVLHWHLLYQ